MRSSACCMTVAMLTCSVLALADVPVTKVPFIYETNRISGQATDPEFRKRFDDGAPAYYHLRSEYRFLGRYGFGGMVLEMRSEDYDTFLREMRDHTDFLHEKGVRWITPYLCNQTLSGNDQTRFGAWEVFDHWERFENLGLGPKPPDPLTWMQREPSGNLHYNYQRMCYLGRGGTSDEIRYAPCPNNPDWRRICNAEARLTAEAGFDGLFVDNCILHCYCISCETRFQQYLRNKYSPSQLQEAFGADDYGDVTLHADGDLIHWARSFDGFIPWLEGRYPSEERRVAFDTTGPLDSLHVDNAGSGTLVGEAVAFIREHALQQGAQPTFDAVRLSNPALQSPMGRLRWVETKMFWAASMGDMLRELRDAGRTVKPAFFVNPNWGSMRRFNAAVGRSEDAKDMRRWKAGADIQMHEEYLTPGLIAPGLVLSYDMQLRFAFANGVRAALLPHSLLSGRDAAEVVLAETAASGGSLMVGWNAYPGLWKTYQLFFRDHADLYDGYHSAARVGLAHLFDQAHYLNTEHLRQVYALSRYLADQQIPFDHIIEDDLTSERLKRYRVVVFPHTAFLDDAEVDAIRDFVRAGGVAVILGDFATHDTYCRRRTESVALGSSKNGGRAVRFASLSEVLPHNGVFFTPALQAAKEGKFGAPFDNRELRIYNYLAEFDRQLWIKRYQEPGPLTAVIAEALGITPHLLDPNEASGLRSTLYVKTRESGQKFVIHLVNMNIPLTVPESERTLRPVTGLTLKLPVPKGFTIVSATAHAPGAGSIRLSPSAKGDTMQTLTLDRLDAYAVIAVDCTQ
jgi:hypothetical protein